MATHDQINQSVSQPSQSASTCMQVSQSISQSADQQVGQSTSTCMQTSQSISQ